MNKDRNTNFLPGITLIEVALALFIIIISVAFSLRLMANLVSYAGREGQTIDVTRAVSIGQTVIDNMRDRPLPPTSYMRRLAWTGLTEEGEEKKIRQGDPEWSELLSVSYDDDDDDLPETSYDGLDYAHYHFVVTASLPGVNGPVAITGDDFSQANRVDRLGPVDPAGSGGLLFIEVDVYRGPAHLFRAGTYKARHGYY